MSLFSTLNTGMSGLKAADVSIATTSQNIANATNPFYTRQRVNLSASTALNTIPGQVGQGVSVTSIVRIHDEFVYTRLKQSSNQLSYSQFSSEKLKLVAQAMPDLQDSGLQADISEYFSAWNNFASNPSDTSQKINLIQNAQNMTQTINSTKESIRNQQNSVNEQIKSTVDEMNQIGQQIANLNKEISRIESVGLNNANDLRDKRDELELTLSALIDLSVFKGNTSTNTMIDANMTDQGTDYHLNIGGFSFVDGPNFHPIVLDNSSNASAYYSIYYEQQDGKRVDMSNALQGGKLGAMLDLRGREISANGDGYPTDGTLQGYIDDLDAYAKGIIVQTNNIYAQSAKESMVSNNHPDIRPDTALVNYDSSIRVGTFDMVAYDASGNEVARRTIEITPLTTMEDLARQMNADMDDNGDNNSGNDIDNFFTTIYNKEDGSLNITQNLTAKGYTIGLEDNGSNIPGALGMSRFFDGNDASTISVNSELVRDPSKLKASTSPTDGNNNMANMMVQLQYDAINFYKTDGTISTETISGFYRNLASQVGLDASVQISSFEMNTALYKSVYTEHQSISGVNVDEELIDLMKFQTGYSANAKVISTIDQMLDVLLGLKS